MDINDYVPFWLARAGMDQGWKSRRDCNAACRQNAGRFLLFLVGKGEFIITDIDGSLATLGKFAKEDFFSQNITNLFHD